MKIEGIDHVVFPAGRAEDRVAHGEHVEPLNDWNGWNGCFFDNHDHDHGSG